jgi:hypothetical protein
MPTSRPPPACRGYASTADRITAGCPLLAAPTRAPEPRVSLVHVLRQFTRPGSRSIHGARVEAQRQNVSSLSLTILVARRCRVASGRAPAPLAPQESELPTAATAFAVARHARRSSLSPCETSDTCSTPKICLTSALKRSAMNLYAAPHAPIAAAVHSLHASRTSQESAAPRPVTNAR